jgi:hydrogenase expression/formation protein HypD
MGRGIGEIAKHHQEALLNELHTLVDQPLRLMVVCGTQYRTLLRHGLMESFPEELELLPGPGCGVCVMPTGHVDAFVKVAHKPDVITAACGDLIKMPGSIGSLETAAQKGCDVRLITTPMEAIDIACGEPEKTVVYPAVGFEATAPSVAETILEAARLGVSNFCVIPSIRLLPPGIDLLLGDSELKIQGLLCSDHIHSFSDVRAYAKLSEKHQLSCYVGGFKTLEILEGLVYLVRQAKKGNTSFDDHSSSFVYSSLETVSARKVVSDVFFTVETLWRGLGSVQQSGLVIRDELSLYDAVKRFNIRYSEGDEGCLCQCNVILSGHGLPTDCPSFGMGCTRESPVGPCMISQEGVCASYFSYGRDSLS